MRLFFVLLLLALPAAHGHGPGAANDFGGRRVLIIGIDGCRADALKKLVDTGRVPNLKALIDGGSVTFASATVFSGSSCGPPATMV